MSSHKRKRCSATSPEVELWGDDYYGLVPSVRCKKLALLRRKYCRVHLKRKKITMRIDLKKIERRRARRKKEKIDRRHAHEILRTRQRNAK